MNHPDQAATALTLSDDDWAQLAHAHAEYRTQVNPAYDEILHQVSERALASAVLTAAAPGRMTVYDRRARNGLTKLGLDLARTRRYGHYMKRIEQLRSCASERGLGWTARDVDLALYTLGKVRKSR